ncbi:MAG: DUF4340 domain-containing protein [Stagnimonas sp.]|nr:DUF4340 domain-containing protein [Stagnimonas sp.]
MNRARLNLLLVVIVLALGAGAWMAKRHKDKPKETLTPLAAEGVNKIVIEWPGSPTIQLEKQGAEWLLQAPVKSRADRFEAVGATSLASTEVQSTLDGDGIDLKELGLDPPNHTVTLNDVKVEFGGSDPLQSRRYVRVDGVVKLIEDPATAALDKDYADLISKNLFAPGDTLVKIELPAFTLTKGPDGNWTAPAGTANATPAALKTLADGWKDAQAMWNEAAAGETASGGTVRITTQQGQVHEFVVASVDPQFMLYNPALRVRHQLSKALADALLKLPEPAPAPATPATPATP